MSFIDKLKEQGIILTEAQKNAVLSTEGKHLLLACPGSGKTTVIVIKTAYLIYEKNVNPNNILTVTFSRAAAIDMKKRYTKLFNNKGPTFSTIHSFCYKIMQEYFRRKGLRKENLEGNNSKNISKHHLINEIYYKVNNTKPNEDMIEEIIGKISYFKNMIFGLKKIDESNTGIKNFKEMYIMYEKYKHQNNLYDFDDMLIFGYKALKEYNDLLLYYQRRYKYIQVDEAQDNSRVQNAIIRLLVTNENNLFMVADDDQTIYEWRGAFPEAIFKFEKIYSPSKIHRMEQNFRSSQEIVLTSNQFIKANKNRYDKNLFTLNKSFNPIKLVNVNTEKNQVDFVIKSIEKNKGKLSEHAILYRNNVSAISFVDELDRKNIPFQIRGYNNTFFSHWVVDDIINFLDFSLDNSKLKFLENIYYKNNVYISKKGYANALKNFSKKQSIFDSIKINGGLKDFQIAKLEKLEQILKKLPKLPVDLAIYSIEEEIGYGKWIEDNANRRGTSVESVKTILKILRSIARNCKNIKAFKERLKELQQKMERSQGKRQDGVVLSTVHSSKGLEFDTVYLVDLVEGIFPPSKSDEISTDEIEAERRLFYVGMTRAKYNLFLLTMYYKNKSPVNPSIFFEEIDEIINGKKSTKKIRFINNEFGVKSKIKENKDMYIKTIPYYEYELAATKENNDFSKNQFSVGDIVKHFKYGVGEIINITKTLIIIKIKDGSVKKFDLKAVVEKNLIEKIS